MRGQSTDTGQARWHCGMGGRVHRGVFRGGKQHTVLLIIQAIGVQVQKVVQTPVTAGLTVGLDAYAADTRQRAEDREAGMHTRRAAASLTALAALRRFIEHSISSSALSASRSSTLMPSCLA